MKLRVVVCLWALIPLLAIGGGVDFRVSHRFSIRPLQVDYLLFNELGTGTQNQNNLRVSTGVVFHF